MSFLIPALICFIPSASKPFPLPNYVNKEGINFLVHLHQAGRLAIIMAMLYFAGQFEKFERQRRKVEIGEMSAEWVNAELQARIEDWLCGRSWPGPGKREQAIKKFENHLTFKLRASILLNLLICSPRNWASSSLKYKSLSNRLPSYMRN